APAHQSPQSALVGGCMNGAINCPGWRPANARRLAEPPAERPLSLPPLGDGLTQGQLGEVGGGSRVVAYRPARTVEGAPVRPVALRNVLAEERRDRHVGPAHEVQ